MNTPRHATNPRVLTALAHVAVGALLAGSLQSFAAAAEAVSASTAPQSSARVASEATAKSTAPDASVRTESTSTNLSRGVESILTLADAKISKEVMLKFIETCTFLRTPTTAELVVLKDHNVPDDVVVALMNRGTALDNEAQSLIQNRRVAAPAIVSALSTDGEMDPDSYDFWWYHYGYPRALSYSYRTLTPYLPNYSYTYANPYYSAPQFPYSTGYSAGRRPVNFSHTRFGSVPAGSYSRHASLAVPSAVTLQRRNIR